MISVAIALLALASVWDVALHRIPNALAVGVAVTGLIAAGTNGGLAMLSSSALATAIVFAILFPVWTRRLMGGGDLKLAAATAAWLGIARVPMYLVGSAIAIGALSVICYFASTHTARTEVRRNLAYAAKGFSVAPPITTERGRSQVPAGAGFALAAIVMLVMTGGL